jgi:hypothetical protein
MEYPSYFRALLVLGLASQASCSEQLIAPATPEILPVSVQTRSPAPNEKIPTVQLSGGSGALTIRVTRAAMCATIVSAGVSRRGDELAIVARVSSDPLALCIGIYQVVDYQGTITSLRAGRYQVRIFEAIADGTPQLIGSGAVTVSPPAA